ncbi:hypothetical protein C8R46DRAFT_1215098 [Mycena filopes]|nr:hypothetical protein C8R46DRAFT_1215098 [Mycena filopes]
MTMTTTTAGMKTEGLSPSPLTSTSASPTSTSPSTSTTTSPASTTGGNGASTQGGVTGRTKPRPRRPSTPARRATHNAVERLRRESLNARFAQLASMLPPLRALRRPSKSAIVGTSIATVNAARRHRVLAAQTLRAASREAEGLRRGSVLVFVAGIWGHVFRRWGRWRVRMDVRMPVPDVLLRSDGSARVAGSVLILDAWNTHFVDAEDAECRWTCAGIA